MLKLKGIMQVNAVVQDDILIVPHGSQNTNLIFARPGTIVIEVSISLLCVLLDCICVRCDAYEHVILCFS
jgi:hypothetical protein